MYDFASFTAMMKDQVRVSSYLKAIDRAVAKDCVVVDIGAGTGAFSIYAALAGARRVYAIEPNPLIEIGKREALRLGLQDKIHFFKGLSCDFTPEEPCDVLISDLRGVMPFLGDGVSVVADARRRFMKDQGVIIPCRDRMFAQPIQCESWYQTFVASPWSNNQLGIDFVVHSAVWSSCPRPAPRTFDANLFSKREVGQIEWGVTEDPRVFKSLEWSVDSATQIHALLIWFESELDAFTRMSGYPAEEGLRVYGSLALPLEQPLCLRKGYTLQCDLVLSGVAEMSCYSWHTRVLDEGGKVIKSLSQSSLKTAMLEAASAAPLVPASS